MLPRPSAAIIARLGTWWCSIFYTTGVLPADGNGSGRAFDHNGALPYDNPAVPDAPTNLHAGYADASTIALSGTCARHQGDRQLAAEFQPLITPYGVHGLNFDDAQNPDAHVWGQIT